MTSIAIVNPQTMTLNMKPKNINLKTFKRVVKENIKEAKRDYYFKTFTAHKNDLRKTWRTIGDTLNKKSFKENFPLNS